VHPPKDRRWVRMDPGPGGIAAPAPTGT
jgi:hypothetical protein